MACEIVAEASCNRRGAYGYCSPMRDHRCGIGREGAGVLQCLLLSPMVPPHRDNGLRAGRGGVVITGSSPEAFHLHVCATTASLRARSHEHRLLFVKSWNEWAEGNHLEPDLTHGHGFSRVPAEEAA